MNLSQYISILGPTLAALIAGLITFLITVLSKEQKTSEFRQAWIDTLRNDIAELVGVLGVTISMVRHRLRGEVSMEEILEYLYNKEVDFIKMEVLISKIRLRVNPTEHNSFLSALGQLEGLAQDKTGLMDSDISDKLEKDFLKESQEMLKLEWERVKRGEPVFRLIKWLSLGVFVLALTGGCVFTYNLLF